MKSHTLKATFANIVIRIVRAFNVPVRDNTEYSQQQANIFPSSTGGDEREEHSFSKVS
jgi:hypothetical protein